MTPADLAGIRAEITERNRRGETCPEWLLNVEREADAQVSTQESIAGYPPIDWGLVLIALAVVAFILYQALKS